GSRHRCPLWMILRGFCGLEESADVSRPPRRCVARSAFSLGLPRRCQRQTVLARSGCTALLRCEGNVMKFARRAARFSPTADSTNPGSKGTLIRSDGRPLSVSDNLCADVNDWREIGQWKRAK